MIERNTHIEFSLIKKILQNSNIERVELEKIISEDNYKIYYIIDSIVQAYYEYEIEERIIEEEMKLVKIDVDTFHFDASVESIEK